MNKAPLLVALGFLFFAGFTMTSNDASAHDRYWRRDHYDHYHHGYPLRPWWDNRHYYNGTEFYFNTAPIHPRTYYYVPGYQPPPPNDWVFESYAMREAFENTPTGNSVSWINPNTGNSGKITVTRTEVGIRGPCRDFQRSLVSFGIETVTFGTACRNQFGAWLLPPLLNLN